MDPLTEYVMSIAPNVDIIEALDKAQEMSIKILFFYSPLVTCLLVALKGFEMFIKGLILFGKSKNGRYFKGRVIAKHREFGEFADTGRILGFNYAVVKYKNNGEICTCISNRLKRTKIGDKLSVYVTADGDEHLPAPGVIYAIFGVFIFIISIVAFIYTYNAFEMLLWS